AERIADRHVDQPQLWIDDGGFPNPTTVALTANPCRARRLPALILCVLRNRVEVPLDLAGFRVDREHMAARNVTLASPAADVQRAVVILRRRGEPISHADGRFDVGVTRRQYVHDYARLAVFAEALERCSRLRVEREQKRSAGGVDDSVAVHHTPV